MAGFRWSEETELHRGHVISLVQVGVEGPAGERFDRDVVRHPGAVSVVPLHQDGTVTMVRQYRVAIDGDLLEIPAGKRDVAGEPAQITAQRELAEEVGLRAGRLVKLAEFYNSPGFSDEYSHVFLATELEEVPSEAQGIEEEHMTIERVVLDEVPAMIADGRICDAKSIIGLLAARTVVADVHRGDGGHAGGGS
ncbi:MAG TPA: NUDIX hydrolase [Acidimicrobiales bacterium]|jgi:ADP-ribose pyrophosphatase|nr:NUDIX hydrolase [Acidimicrobiales bacterium]